MNEEIQEGKDNPESVNTDGGTYVDGSVNTGGGDFIGRDQYLFEDVKGNIHIGQNVVYAKTEFEELQENLAQDIHTLRKTLRRDIELTEGKQPEEPYRHLDYFDLEHRNVFFGRNAALKDLVDKVCGNQDKSRLTLFRAPSGAGKTSLLRAGLMPALINLGHLPVYVDRSEQPIHSIKFTIFPNPPYPDKLLQVPLHVFLSWIGKYLENNEKVIIILDHFEDFFIRPTEMEQKTFITAFRDCYRAGNLPVRFLLSMREDSFSKMDLFSIDTVYDNRYRLAPLTRNEAKLAIEKPLENTGFHWQPKSVELLLDQLQMRVIDPPQLQLVCATQFQSQKIKQTELTLDLEELRSIEAHFLKRVMDPTDPDDPYAMILTKDERDIAWRILKYLVTSRGSVASSKVDKLYENIGAQHTLEPLLEKLTRARLLRRAVREQTTYIEVVHDILAAEISKYETEEEKLSKAIHEVLRRAVTDWQHFGEMRSHLMRPATFDYVNEYCGYLKNQGKNELAYLLRSALALISNTEYWFRAAIEMEVNIRPIILESLSSNNFQERLEALKLLEQVADTYWLKNLTALLIDDYPQVRALAILLLERLQPTGEWRSELLYECYIPAGVFISGSATEGTVKQVYTHAFYLGKYPVTNVDYKRYMDALGQPFDLSVNKPVVNVSSKDATNYAAWGAMRLPTEIEWEKAASWNDITLHKTVYPWGNTFETRKCNSYETSYNMLNDIGTYSPAGDSFYGVADMAGTVWEWCATDQNHENVHQSEGVKNRHFLKGQPETNENRDATYRSYTSEIHDLQFLRSFLQGEFRRAEIQALSFLLASENKTLQRNLPLFRAVEELIEFLYEHKRINILLIMVSLLHPHFRKELANLVALDKTQKDPLFLLLLTLKDLNDAEVEQIRSTLKIVLWEIPTQIKIRQLYKDLVDAIQLLKPSTFDGNIPHSVEANYHVKSTAISRDKKSNIVSSCVDILVTYFNESELLDFCFEHYGNYAYIADMHHTARAEHLVLYYSLIGHLPKLQQDILHERPFLQLPENGQFTTSRKPTPDWVTAMQVALAKSLTVEDLRTLAFELGIDYENLQDDSPDEMAKDLVQYCLRHERTTELKMSALRHRPKELSNLTEQEESANTLLEIVPLLEEEKQTLQNALWFVSNQPTRKGRKLTARKALTELLQSLDRYLFRSEINRLYFELGIDYENLPGKYKRDKARELLVYCVRNGMIFELGRQFFQLRPHVFQQVDYVEEFLFDLLQVQKTTDLQMMINQYFIIDEIYSLCFDLGIKYSRLPGRNKTDKVAMLISICEDTGIFVDLIQRLRSLRPHVRWWVSNTPEGVRLEQAFEDKHLFSELLPTSFALRGGSYKDTQVAATSLSRVCMEPDFSGHDTVGFRLALSPLQTLTKEDDDGH